MGQIMFSRNPTGTIGLGLFVVAISAFLLSTLDPLFGPVAVGCIVAGAVGAVILGRRRSSVPHISPQDANTSDEMSRPIKPR
jgi:membrane-bound ClpP family serine protease